jgi:RHS repeat-associated protein
LGLVGENLNVSRFILSDVIYDPYGVATVSGSVTPTFQYAGYYAHQESGLNLTWYRGYDPVIGRWQARDPLPNAERLQGPNLYSYVKNRDLNLRDPFGLEGAEGFGIPENPAPQSPWDPRVSDQGRQNYSCALQNQKDQMSTYFDGVGAIGLGVAGIELAPGALGWALLNPSQATQWGAAGLSIIGFGTGNPPTNFPGWVAWGVNTIKKSINN